MEEKKHGGFVSSISGVVGCTGFRQAEIGRSCPCQGHLLISVSTIFGIPQMAVELSYTEVCRNNRLVIFDGLGANDPQTGRRLHEDITDHANSIEQYGYCTRHVIKNKIMLAAHLRAMEVECRAGVLLPALHFECHGDSEKGLLISSSGEFVPWLELASLIAPLNAATRNSVAVVMATCHGYNLTGAVHPGEPCQFNFLIAPDRRIKTGALQDSLLPFYREVISTGELRLALRHLDNSFQRFIAGEFFYREMAAFYVKRYTAKIKREMTEKAVSNKVARGGGDSPQDVKAARDHAKRHIRNPEAIYQFLEQIFFHGQNHIPYEEMRKFVDYQKSILQ